MMARTVLRLRARRRAISRTAIPSWCNRKTALRLSVAIMELSQGVEKGPRPAQNPRRQQMALRMKGPALQPRVLAFAHHPLHILLGQFQVAEQDPLKLVAPVGALGHLPHPFQRQRQVALEDFPAKGLRSPEAAVGQLLHLPHAQTFAADRQHKLLDLRWLHPVHAHELAQRIHV